MQSVDALGTLDDVVPESLEDIVNTTDHERERVRNRSEAVANKNSPIFPTMVVLPGTSGTSLNTDIKPYAPVGSSSVIHPHHPPPSDLVPIAEPLRQNIPESDRSIPPLIPTPRPPPALLSIPSNGGGSATPAANMRLIEVLLVDRPGMGISDVSEGGGGVYIYIQIFNYICCQS